MAIALLLFGAMLPGRAEARELRSRVLLSPGRLDLSGAGPRMEGFDPGWTPGRPALPRRQVRVALHPAADLATLRVHASCGPTDRLPGRHDLRPNPPHLMAVGRAAPREHWGEAGTVLAGRDLDAYGGHLFPRRPVRRGRVTDRRGLLLLSLLHRPLRYRHRGGELHLERHCEAEVRYRLRPGAPPFAPDPQLAGHLEGVANAAQALPWYAMDRTISEPDTKLGYAILIPDTLSAQSAKLKDFVKQKESLGFSVTIVGTKDLAAVGVGPKGGDAERMRGWLQKNYKAKNLRYVLIIGNPDPSRAGVPMKNTYAFAKHTSYSTITPSDYYYADLTGNWDLDGDAQVGEYPDDKGTGGTDFTPEVYVGRIPVYDDNAAALDLILAKTMAYAADTGDRTWRKRVLMPAAMLFFEKQYGKSNIRVDGATMADAIWKQVINPAGLSRTSLYEESGVDPSQLKGDLPLTRENVIKAWNNGYGLVTWFGHGSANGVYRSIWTKDNGDKIPSYSEVSSPAFLDYDDVLKLDASRPSIVYHGSCSNGTPERPDNIGYGLLLGGAVATVSSTRVAVVSLGGTLGTSDANIFGAERDFARYLLAGDTTGVALFKAKQKIGESLGMLTWFTRMELSLYGDPSLSLTSCTASAQCDDGKACNGKESCNAGQCLPGVAVACSAVDPCTEATCQEPAGACVLKARPEGEACDDGLFCTADDRCVKGRCQGEARCRTALNPCVSARCDESARTCSLQTLASEGQACQLTGHGAGSCKAGLCEVQAEDTGCAVAGGAGSPAWLLLGWLLLVRRRKTRS